MEGADKHRDVGDRRSPEDSTERGVNSDSNQETGVELHYPNRGKQVSAAISEVENLGSAHLTVRQNQVAAVRAATIVLVACFLATVPWLDLAHFSSRGEPREALVAQAIVNSGNWILPQGYGGGVPSKPPLLHWCIAGLTYLFGSDGVSEFTARLPSALASLLLLSYLSYFLARRGWHFEALVAPLLVFFSPEWFRAGVTCRVDMLHSATEAIGLLLLFRWWELGMERLPLGAIVALAGSVLTKGPVGIVLPVLIFGVFLAFKGTKPKFACSRLGLVIMPALVLPAVWYVVAAFVGGREFLHTVYDENLGRFFGHMEVPAHVHGIWYLVGAMVLGALPMFVSIFVVVSRRLVQFRRRRSSVTAATRIAGKERIRVKPSLNFADQLVARVCGIEALVLFSLITVGTTFLFYALPSSKRGVYLLVSYPFLAILVAALAMNGREEAGGTEQLPRRESPSVLTHGAKGLVLSAALAVIVGHLVLGLGAGRAFLVAAAEHQLVPNLGAVRLGALSAVLGGGVVSLFFGSRVSLGFNFPRWSESLFRVAVGLWCTFIVSLAGIFPLVAWRASELRAAEILVKELSQDTELRSFGYEFYGISFYLGRPIIPLGEIPPRQGDIVLTNKERAAAIDLSPYKMKAEVLRDFSGDKLANSLKNAVLLVLRDASLSNK